MDWSTADVVIFVVAAYLALVTLTRLMRSRHAELVAQVRRRMHSERRRPKNAEQSADQQQDAA